MIHPTQCARLLVLVHKLVGDRFLPPAATKYVWSEIAENAHRPISKLTPNYLRNTFKRLQVPPNFFNQ